MRDVAAGCAAFSPEAEEGRDYPQTEFQKKFLAEGRPFYTLLLRRNA
jgi:hypothetical protein